MKKQRGITLVALVITVIILLILAGVALSALTGHDSIIENANSAVGTYNDEVAKEQGEMSKIQELLSSWIGGNGSGTGSSSGGNSGLTGGSGSVSYGVAGLTRLTGTANVDANGLATENTLIQPNENSNVLIVIPEGFAPAILNGSNSTTSGPGEDGSVKSIMPASEWKNITEEQINQGIVIVNNAITYTDTVPDFEEYVWVSIPNTTDFTTTVMIRKAMVGTSYWDNPTSPEYQNMVSSVTKNRGFYVGRYEASANGAIAQSKRGQTSWTSIKQPIAVTACNSNTISNNMHLMYGIQWDSIVNWLIGNATIESFTAGVNKTMDWDDAYINGSSWGNIPTSTGNAAINSGTGQNTGSSEYWKANNIYDLNGNIIEWTQERTLSLFMETEGPVLRGDAYMTGIDSFTVSGRLRWSSK